MWRRNFISLLLGGLLYGCRSPAPKKERAVRLKKVDEVKDGWSVLTGERLIVVREGRHFGALSLVCTHQHCLLQQRAGGLICPCHGSTFSTHGIPERGPATVPLPWYRLSVDGDGWLVVHLDDQVPAGWRLML